MDWLGILNNTAFQIFAPATLAYALAALGLAMHFGFAGLLNFGIAGFMAIGAYGYAIFSLTFGLRWYLGMLVGVLASIVFAAILGIPTLRLRGDYLAIVTIAAAEILRLLFTTTAFIDVTGSADGLTGFNKSFESFSPFPSGNYGFGPWTYNAFTFWIQVFAVVLLIICGLAMWALMRSPWGRVIKGIREDEDAVRALGKNVFAYKMQALMIGGVFGALGGIVLAISSNVQPGTYITSTTFFIWTALLLGGAATIFGPILGSIIFWVLQAFLGSVFPAMASSGLLPLTSQQASQLKFVLVGLGLMLLVIYRPQGILGDKRELTFVK